MSVLCDDKLVVGYYDGAADASRIEAWRAIATLFTIRKISAVNIASC